MSSFLFGFALVLLVSFGARDQLLVARLAGRTGPGLLVAACVSATLSACIMAWGGNYVAEMLFPAAKHMLTAMALMVAAGELAWPIRDKIVAEPTHSIFAGLLVLSARQIGDASRFLVFALAAATASPVLVAAGGRWAELRRWYSHGSQGPNWNARFRLGPSVLSSLSPPFRQR